MATNHLTFSGSASAVQVRTARMRRLISREAGLALEKLSHAIEYLIDEFMNEEGAPPFRRDGRFAAIELLMALNRNVYFSCPEVPCFRDRLASLIRHIV
jgi:hypothetical protein